MKKIRGRKAFFIMLLFIIILNVSYPLRAETWESSPRVLFISSYSYSWPTVPLQLKGIEKALGSDILLDIQFMNAKEINPDTDIEEVCAELKKSIQRVGHYDAVIVGDDDALHFIEKYKEELFPDIPVVFEAINDISFAKEMAKNPMITGIVEQIPYDANIELIKKLFPETKRIVAVVDNTATGYGEQQQFEKNKSKYPELVFEEVNISEYSMNEFEQKIASYSTDTVVMYLIMSMDKDGYIYTSASASQTLGKHAKVPVMRYVQAGIGDGVLGGKIVLHEQSAEIAGNMVRQILEGTNPKDIPVQMSSPEGYYFDYQVMKKYGIKKSELPTGTVFVHDDVSAWNNYVTYILITILVVAFLTIIRIELTKRKSNKERNQMQQLAIKDNLTGCYSRNYLYLSLVDEKSGEWIDKNKKYTVTEVDVDHFKVINDTYGHDMGDVLLQKIGQVLIHSCNSAKGDCVLRLGGDEFILLYDDISQYELKKRLDQIYSEMAEIQLEDAFHKVTLSMGVKLWTERKNNFDVMLKAADKKLYISKRSGRNRYTI